MRSCRALGWRVKARGLGVSIKSGGDQAESGMEGDSGELLAAVKGAVTCFTRSLALSLAPEVRVNCIAQGMVYTPMVYSRGMTPEMRETRRQRSLLQTEGTGWDVGNAVRYLASDESRWVTGTVLPVDAGATAGAGRLPVPKSDARRG